MKSYKTLPHKGIECILVDGTLQEVKLPGGYVIRSNYSSLTIWGPDESPLDVTKTETGDEIPF